MRDLIITLTLLALAAPAPAVDLGAARPDKPAAHHATPPTDPKAVRQGGDTFGTAMPIAIPYTGSGTTTGYADDADEVCPFDAWAPDVFYEFTAPADMSLDIDLCGSSYDTKVYVYDENLAIVACNDDHYWHDDDPCGRYVSKIEDMPVTSGVRYFVVIDGGDSTSHGEYLVEIVEHVPCVVDCPPGAELEGEPPIVDEYEDHYNGGCGYGGEGGWSAITQPVFCGVSGWYTFQGSQYRDTDWFEIVVPEVGYIEITGDAEFQTYLFELAPQDCNTVEVVQDAVIGPCAEGSMVIPGDPGSTVWFWIGPTVFDGPVYEYDYVFYTNLTGVAVEARSWSSVKGLF